jgi:hypothetical protein
VEVEVCLLRRERGRARKGFEFIYTRRLVVGKGKSDVISFQDCGQFCAHHYAGPSVAITV